MRSDAVHYLESKGFHYKSAESPDLWTHLEGTFAATNRVGPHFTRIPADFVSELIALGEDALLEAMVAQHTDTGKVGAVDYVIDLPYLVGTEGYVPVGNADASKVIHLVDQPGTAHEHIIHILPMTEDEMPRTNKVTVTGGLYADGHTVGYYDIRPGDHAEATNASACAYLATASEITALVHDMQAKADDIAVVTRQEFDAMLERVKKLLG